MRSLLSRGMVMAALAMAAALGGMASAETAKPADNRPEQVVEPKIGPSTNGEKPSKQIEAIAGTSLPAGTNITTAKPVYDPDGNQIGLSYWDNGIKKLYLNGRTYSYSTITMTYEEDTEEPNAHWIDINSWDNATGKGSLTEFTTAWPIPGLPAAQTVDFRM